MIKFKCTNKDCSQYGIEIKYYQVKISIKDGQTVTSEDNCPKCLEKRTEIVDDSKSLEYSTVRVITSKEGLK